MTTNSNTPRIKCDFSNPALYNPVYIPLFRDRSEFLHLFGSAGSGKSRFQAQKEIVLSFDSNRANRKTLVIRKVGVTLKDSVYTEILGVIADWNLTQFFDVLKSPLHITNKITGVEFLFKGLDDPEKVKSISKIDRVWIEEATELETRNELDQLMLRLRGYAEKQITLSYNPIDENHWLNADCHIARPDGHRIFKTTYRDNIRMLARDPSYAVSIERLKETNPNYYRVYGLGEWGQVVEGLIYSVYETGAEMPDEIHAYGLDFGYTNPTALVAIHRRDALPKPELIVQEILYESGLDGEALVRRFDEKGVRKDVRMIGDSARPEMIATLRKAGYDCRPSQKGPGSVLTGINKIRAHTLRIAAGSKELVKEIQNYQKRQVQGIWLEEPAPNQASHGLDGARYGLEAFELPVMKQSVFRY